MVYNWWENSIVDTNLNDNSYNYYKPNNILTEMLSKSNILGPELSYEIIFQSHVIYVPTK